MLAELVKTSAPSVVGTDWKVYSDGEYEFEPEDMKTTAPAIVSVSWSGTSKRTYSYKVEAAKTVPPYLLTPPNWVQYGKINYDRFTEDKIKTNVPAVTATTWS